MRHRSRRWICILSTLTPDTDAVINVPAKVREVMAAALVDVAGSLGTTCRSMQSPSASHQDAHLLVHAAAVERRAGLTLVLNPTTRALPHQVDYGTVDPTR